MTRCIGGRHGGPRSPPLKTSELPCPAAVRLPFSFTSPTWLKDPTPVSSLRSSGRLTSPAGPNHESRFPAGRVDETIVMDEGRVKRDAISIERDCGKLEVQSIVVPFIITDLGEQGKGKNPSLLHSGN